MVKRPDQTADLGLVDAFTSGTRPGDRDDLLDETGPVWSVLLITHQGLVDALSSRTTRLGDRDDLRAGLVGEAGRPGWSVLLITH